MSASILNRLWSVKRFWKSLLCLKTKSFFIFSNFFQHELFFKLFSLDGSRGKVKNLIFITFFRKNFFIVHKVCLLKSLNIKVEVKHYNGFSILFQKLVIHIIWTSRKKATKSRLFYWKFCQIISGARNDWTLWQGIAIVRHFIE